MHLENSTIGRSFHAPVPAAPPPGLRALASLRGPLRALGWVSPAAAARVVERLWFTPPRAAISDEARRRLEAAERLPLAIGRRSIAAWRFGRGPAVLLMHGWGGHAGQLLPFVEPLLAAGRSVVAVDAPSHGQSSASAMGRRQANFVEFAAAMRAAADHVGGLDGIVAHSGGAIATNLALARGLAARRLVLVAPMARPHRFADAFASVLGLSDAIDRRWRARGAARVGFTWDEVDLTGAPARGELPDTLVVHDCDDREVPLVEGRAVFDAWPGASMIATAGLGHRRILRDAEVVRRAVGFLVAREEV